MTNDGSDAWARQMLAQIQEGAARAKERRDRLAMRVDGLAAGFSRLGANKWEPRLGTPAQRDREAEHLRLGSRCEPVLDVLRYETTINILSAADQLRGFSVLLRAEASLMGAVIVARGVFEACLWAAAIVDPTVSTETRVQRALTRRLARLAAGIRLSRLLETAGGDSSATEVPAGAEDDHHGSARDPHVDIEDVLQLARECDWKIVKAQRAPSIGTQLSVDWLTEHLEHSIGIEKYTWASGSSMAHGEHAADAAAWVEMSNELGRAPAWLMQLWSTGVWAGPRLLLASLEKYMGRTELADEFALFESAFWAGWSVS